MTDRPASSPPFPKALFWLPFLLIFFYAPAQAALFNAQTLTLENGLQVVVVENHRAPIVAHMMWIKAGAADDPYGKSGLAHYLEHLMFKGTAKYPQGQYSQRIARVGGSENAFTTADYTAYHALVGKEQLPLIMDLESDRLANLQITPEKAKPELQVILDERRQRVDDDPYSPFSQQMAAALFPHHPYGTPVIGWKEEIESFTPDDALGFYHQWYNPANTVVVVSGDVKPEEVFALAKNTYGKIPASKPIVRTRVKAPVFEGDENVHLESAQVHERLIEYSLRAPTYRTDPPMAYALEVLQEVLDGSDASYLSRVLIQEKKLATHVEIDYSTGSYDETAFTFSFVPQAGQSDEAVLQGLKDALASAGKALTPEEIANAKQSLMRSSIFTRDSVMSPAYVIGAGLSSGRSLAEVEEWSERIGAVTPEQLQKALEFIVHAHVVTGSVHPSGKENPNAPPPAIHPQGPIQ